MGTGARPNDGAPTLPHPNKLTGRVILKARTSALLKCDTINILDPVAHTSGGDGRFYRHEAPPLVSVHNAAPTDSPYLGPNGVETIGLIRQRGGRFPQPRMAGSSHSEKAANISPRLRNGLQKQVWQLFIRPIK